MTTEVVPDPQVIPAHPDGEPPAIPVPAPPEPAPDTPAAPAPEDDDGEAG